MLKTSRRRPLKIAALIVMIGLALVVLAAGGLVIWLRTSAGGDFVFGQAAKVLAANGLSLTAGQFSGPLPGRLLVRDAVLADAEGVLVKVGLLEVELTPTALISGLVHIPLVKVENPEVFRLPPSSGETEESSGEFSLPVDIRLDQLTVSGGQIHPGSLASLGLNNPALNFNASGLARLEGEGSAVDLEARLSESGGDDLLAAVIKLGAGERAADGAAPLADRLELSVKVHDRPGGLLGELLADPQWPGLRAELTGQGRLNDWRGRLDLSSELWGQVASTLEFQGQTGNLWRDLVAEPAWLAGLAATVKPGSILPAQAAPWTGEELKIKAQGGLTGQEINLALQLAAAGDPAVDLESTVSGLLAPGGGDFQISALIRGLWPAEVNPPLALAADLTLGRQEQNLKSLKVTAPGFDLTTSADRRIDSGAVSAEAALAMADGSLLVAEGLRLAGLEPEAFGGQVDLKAHLDWRGPAEAAEGQLAVTGQSLRWPSEELSRLLGPELTLAADLSGGGGRPFVVEFKEAAAGEVSLSGQASYDPAENPADSAFSAQLKAGLARLEALSPDHSGPLGLTLEAEGRLRDFHSELSLASPLITAPQGAVKDLSLKAAISGALLTAEAGRELSGDLELNAADSPGGPLELATDWRYQETDSGLEVTLANLSGRLAGLELAGGLKAALGGAQPSLDGSLSADIATWSQLAALTGQPLSGGPAQLRINLGAAGGRQTASANLDLPALRLGSGAEELLSLKQTSLDFKADDLFGQPDLDLDLKLGAGLAGPLSWSSGTVTASGQAGQGSFSSRLNQTQLVGVKSAAGSGLKIDGQYNLTGEPVIDLTQLDIPLAQGGLKLKDPVQVTLGENLKISPLAVSFRPAGQLTAELDLTPGAMKIKADLTKLPYSFFKPFVGEALPGGEIQSLAVDLNQGPAGLAGDFALKTQVSPPQLKNIKPTLDLNGRLTGGSAPALTVEGTIAGGSGWPADGQFAARVPLTPGPDGGFPQPNQNGALQGRLKFTGALGPLWRILDQPDRTLTGMAQIQAEVGGTLAQPRPQGTAYLAGGRYEDGVLGLLISDITLEAHSTPDLPVKALLSAKDGRGGGLAFEAEMRDLDNPTLSAKGRLSRFSPLHRDDLIVFISGDLGAEGPLDKLSLTSNLHVDRGEVDLKIALAGGSVSTLDISAPEEQITAAGGGMRLNLKVSLPNQFFIRGFGMESEWKGDLTIGGTTGRPSLVGQLAPVRGYMEFLSKEFEFTGGDISFNGGTNPGLNLELTNNGPNITAIIRAGGTAKTPTLSLESRPPLPEEEVLAQVLFGKNASSISRFEALQLASAIKDLADFGKGGNFNAIGSVRSTLGLDVLRLGGTDNNRERRASSLSGSMGQEMTGASATADSAQSDDLSVEAGKYLSDNIYVGVEHSAVGGAAVRLEVELSPRVSLEARTSTESSQVGVGWKKDY